MLLSTKTTTIQDQGPLRVSLVVELKISDCSSIKQVISLDTGSPYLRFQTQVSPAKRAKQIILWVLEQENFFYLIWRTLQCAVILVNKIMVVGSQKKKDLFILYFWCRWIGMRTGSSWRWSSQPLCTQWAPPMRYSSAITNVPTTTTRPGTGLSLRWVTA